MNFDTRFTYLISSVLLLLVALITTFRKKNGDFKANIYLASYFWCYALAAIITMAVLFGYAIKVPHLYRTAHTPALLILPFSYLYLSRILYGKKLKPIDLLHLLPILIYVVDYFPFLVLPASEKLKLYLAESPNPLRLRLAYGEGWFMPDFAHTITRYLLWLGYWIAEVVVLSKAMRNSNHPLQYQAPHQWRWLQLLVASQILLFIPPLLAAIFDNEQAIANWINVAALTASLIQCYYLLFHPEVLYSLETTYTYPVLQYQPSVTKEVSLLEEPTSIEEIEETIAALGKQISEQEMSEIEEKLRQIMDQHKPFLITRYGIRDLANDSGIGVHKLSAYVNKRCGQNFYGFLNQYRIEFCLVKLRSGEHQTKTLEAIAQECGFRSRSTFIRAFKIVTGKTPSEFISANV